MPVYIYYLRVTRKQIDLSSSFGVCGPVIIFIRDCFHPPKCLTFLPILKERLTLPIIQNPFVKITAILSQ